MPALRGLSSGRTLILIDGARVNSERRVGASATFLDPDILEGVEVARGPGSVAYGSDAFGGVIAATTRKVAPGAPLAVRASGTPRHRRARKPHRRRRLEGHRQRQRARRRPRSRRRRLGRARRAPHSTPATATAACWRRSPSAIGQGYLSAGYQGDFGRDIERPRNNSATVRFFYPSEDSHRVTAEYDQARGRPVRRDRPPRLLRPLRAGHRPGPLRHRHHRPQRRARRHQRPRLSGSAATPAARSARPGGRSAST